MKPHPRQPRSNSRSPAAKAPEPSPSAGSVLPSLLGRTRSELEAWCRARKLPRYRGRQLFRQLYGKRAASFAAMTDLPAGIRALLEKAGPLRTARVRDRLVSRDGTAKLVVDLADGEAVECVFIPDPPRRTCCLSIQAGCALGCRFCASGQAGWRRDLGAGEILEQILALEAESGPATHIVFMGVGEPLANLAALEPCLEILSSPDGWGMAPKRITISTAGLPDGIARLASLGRPWHLALSLHAPDDTIRGTLMPLARRYPLDKVLRALRAYQDATGADLTFEYLLVAGVNDAPEQARALVRLLAGWRCHVNLLEYNPVAGSGLTPSSPGTIRHFREILARGKLSVTQRKKHGRDIAAACGQLRLKTPVPGEGFIGSGGP